MGPEPVPSTELRDHPFAGAVAGQEAGPEAVGAVGGDGVVTGGQQGQVQPLADIRPQGSSNTTGQVHI